MKWICFLLLLVTVLPVFSQEFHFRALPANYGADIEQINVLCQSTDGMMWVGTDLGLFSYDGRRFKFFARRDKKLAQVTCLAQAPDGRIWAGFADGHVLTAKFQGYTEDKVIDSIRGTAISSIVFHSPSTVFITTYGHGTWTYGPGGAHRLTAGVLGDLTDVYGALSLQDSTLWLATDDGILVYDPPRDAVVSTIRREQGLKDDIVTRLAKDAQGNVLVGLFEAGIQRYDFSQQRFTDAVSLPVEEGTITRMISGYRADTWIATDRTLWNSRLYQQPRKIQLPVSLKDRIHDIYFDRSGNLWLAAGNRLYIAHTQIEYLYPPVTGIQSVLHLGDRMWYGCANGLFSTDMQGQNPMSCLEHERVNVLSLYADPSGVLWIGTFGQGLFLYDPATGKSRHLTEKDNLSNGSILNIDGTGRHLWLATLGGITEIQWEGHPMAGRLLVSDMLDRFHFPPGYVYDVYASPRGRVWFGTDGQGLFYLQENEFKSLPVVVVNPDSTETVIKKVYSITEDTDGHLWIASAKGQVFCLRQDGQVLRQYVSVQGAISSLVSTGQGEILMIREGEIYSVHSRSGHFGFDQSLDLTSFTPNINAYAPDPDGSVWIADNTLVLHYTPGPEKEQAIRMSFESMSPGSWLNTDQLTIRPDSNYLDIAYVGLWYQDPAAVRYRYMLQGHDPEWIYTEDRRAVYSRLSPGKYTFFVQASRNNEFTDATTLQKEILVLPPFYRRWWFIGLVLAGIGGSLYRYIRARITRLEKMHALEKEKTMLQLHAIQAQVNPHFLFNSFNTLSSIIEEDQKAAVDYVDQLSAFFRGALMHREDELILLSQELEIVRNYVYILKKRYGDNIEIDEAIENTTGWVAPLSIQLLVENAIKHNTVSHEKHLHIRIESNTEWITVSNPVQPKFQSLNESTGFGLSSLLTRYAYLTPRKVEIRNDRDLFTVTIPILYPDQTK